MEDLESWTANLVKGTKLEGKFDLSVEGNVFGIDPRYLKSEEDILYIKFGPESNDNVPDNLIIIPCQKSKRQFPLSRLGQDIYFSDLPEEIDIVYNAIQEAYAKLSITKYKKVCVQTVPHPAVRVNSPIIRNMLKNFSDSVLNISKIEAKMI